MGAMRSCFSSSHQELGGAGDAVLYLPMGLGQRIREAGRVHGCARATAHSLGYNAASMPAGGAVSSSKPLALTCRAWIESRGASWRSYRRERKDPGLRLAEAGRGTVEPKS